MKQKNKNHQNNQDGFVFSTNPNFEFADDNEVIETLAPEKQNLKVQLDKKARAGKQVTLITGFIGKAEDLEVLCKVLKTKCGVGGSAKDSEIIIQGDFREKVTQFLLEKQYKVKKM
jgi:translation initiation factor 1